MKLTKHENPLYIVQEVLFLSNLLWSFLSILRSAITLHSVSICHIPVWVQISVFYHSKCTLNHETNYFNIANNVIDTLCVPKDYQRILYFSNIIHSNHQINSGFPPDLRTGSSCKVILKLYKHNKTHKIFSACSTPIIYLLHE